MAHTSSTSQHYTVHLGARGRLVLPAPVRKTLGLREGDRLIVAVGGSGVVRLISAAQAARQGRGLLREHSGGRRLVDELLQERREEAGSDG
jgi:AbrB family looped-hinge helix DNA binding protein